MIDEKAKYYLGGYDKYDNIGGNTYYSFERGTAVYSGRSTSAIQEVGLLYPSDYVYTYANGVENTCYTDAYDCYSNPSAGWIFDINGGNNHMFTISPQSNATNAVFTIHTSGYVNIQFYGNNNVTGAMNVYPVVYLNSDVTIDPNQGDGSENNPYRLIG